MDNKNFKKNGRLEIYITNGRLEIFVTNLLVMRFLENKHICLEQI